MIGGVDQGVISCVARFVKCRGHGRPAPRGVAHRIVVRSLHERMAHEVHLQRWLGLGLALGLAFNLGILSKRRSHAHASPWDSKTSRDPPWDNLPRSKKKVRGLCLTALRTALSSASSIHEWLMKCTCHDEQEKGWGLCLIATALSSASSINEWPMKCTCHDHKKKLGLGLGATALSSVASMSELPMK